MSIIVFNGKYIGRKANSVNKKSGIKPLFISISFFQLSLMAEDGLATADLSEW